MANGASAADADCLPLLFDRVLCDVPCGGDGTIRKSPTKLTRWRAAAGLRLHATQLAILRNGLSHLAPGGRLVYSTCALDPVQDEAVVGAALAADESLRLLPPTEALPPEVGSGLAHAPGLRTWVVASPTFGSGLDGESQGHNGLYESWEQVPPEHRAPVVAPDPLGS